MPVQPVNHTYSNTDIKPLYPREELISEEYVQNIITSDMVSYRPSAGKIPVGDSEGKIDPAWIIDQVATTSLPIASDTVARDKDNNSAVMTPHSTYVSITNFVHEATTAAAGIVKLTSTLDEATLRREDLAITPKALKEYLRDGFSPATYGTPGVVQFGTDAQISAVLSASKNTTTSSLKTNSQYSNLAVNAYTLYNYISNNHLTLNQDYGIVFRKRSDNSSTVTTEDIGKITVDRSSTVKNMKIVVGSKTATILDSNGDTVLPGTLTVTSRVKQSNGAPPLLGTQNKGSTNQPIYLEGGEVKPIGYTIQANVPANAFSEATTTSKGLMSATDKAKLDGISAGATSYTHPTTAGNKHIPSGGADGQILVYAGSSGTAKWVSQASSGFLPISGGTLNGPITISTGTAYAVGTATPMLSVKYKSTNNKDMASTGVIDVIGTDSSDAYNTPISIGSDDGTTQVGAGESRRGFLGARGLYNNENLYLTADGTINIYPGISNDNATFGGPLTISSAGSTTSGSKVNITGVNTIDATAAAASKLTVNAGANASGNVQPIYFNNGVPTAITQTVGSTSSPVYLNAGKFTAITKIATATKADALSNTTAVGSANVPVYINASGKPVSTGKDLTTYLTKTTNVSEMGRYIDMHYDNATAKYDYDVRIYVNSQGTAAGGGELKITASKVTAGTFSGNLTGNVTGNVTGNASGTSSNVTGTVAIAHGGTGATTRLAAAKNLTNEDVGSSAAYFVTLTKSWGKFGYSSLANIKTALGLKSAAYTESSNYLTTTSSVASATKLASAKTIAIRNWTASWKNGARVNTSKTAASGTFDGTADLYLDLGCKSNCSGSCISACSANCSTGCSDSCSGDCSGGSSGDCCDGY